MCRPSLLPVICALLVGATASPSFARREVGSIAVGTNAYVTCHGNLPAHAEQEYISLEPMPIVVDETTDPAALETFNGTSDNPEPVISALFKRYLETTFNGPAEAACHLSQTFETARAMLEYWRGQYGSAQNAPPKMIAWALPLAPRGGQRQIETARTGIPSQQPAIR